MSRDALLFLMEARIDFLDELQDTAESTLRPLPVHCALPHAHAEPAEMVVGWVGGAVYRGVSFAVTSSRTWVTMPPLEEARDSPTAPFDLDDPSRAAGWVYLCQQPQRRPEAWRIASMAELRYEDCLDMAGINDARGRAATAGRGGGRQKPTFVRVAVSDGKPSLTTDVSELGRARRPYVLVSVSTAPNNWLMVADVVNLAAREAASDGSLVQQAVERRVVEWWAEAGLE